MVMFLLNSLDEGDGGMRHCFFLKKDDKCAVHDVKFFCRDNSSRLFDMYEERGLFRSWRDWNEE